MIHQCCTPLYNFFLQSDAVVIINSGGTILMINNAGARMFHYAKGELDGKSVATLMPQPLSTRHNSWVQRCAMTGQNRILGSLRQVVGITKVGCRLGAILWC